MSPPNPQLENGHTRIANEIIEALMRINLSPHETRVLWFLFRKTYGWRKKTDRLPLSQFAKQIGIERRNVHRALKNLIYKKMVVVHTDDRKRLRYGFQKDYGKWKVSSIRMTEKKSVVHTDTELSSIRTPSKETIQKKEEPSKTFPSLKARYSTALIEEVFTAIRSTRKSGKVAEAVLLRFLQACERYPAEAVEAGIRTYLGKGYADQGKDEAYLLGIIRRWNGNGREHKGPATDALMPPPDSIRNGFDIDDPVGWQAYQESKE